MYYSEEQKDLLNNYTDSVFSNLNAGIREQIKTLSKSVMVPSSNDENVADTVIDYINDYYSSNNITIAESLRIMPKSVLYVIRSNIISLLKRSRVNIEFDCNEQTRLAYGTKNEPITVSCTVWGGESPYERARSFTLTCNTTNGCKITWIAEGEYEIEFSKTGMYTFNATSYDRETNELIASATYKVEVLPSINQPPNSVTIAFTCGTHIMQPDENMAVTVTAKITGGADPEKKGETITAEFPGSSKVQKVSDREYNVTYPNYGTYTVTAKSTDKSGLATTGSTNFTVDKYTLGEVFITTSCGSNLTLGAAPNINKTITVTVSGGEDPAGRAITYDCQCSSAVSVTKVSGSNNKWNVTLGTAGIHVIQGYAISPNGYRAVKTATVQTKAATTSSGTSTGQFVGEKFDSGWTDLVAGCYISEFTLSLKISDGHSSSNDYLVVLGKKTDGTIVILRDVFNSSNRFKTIPSGLELGNGSYRRGNLSSNTWCYTKDPYTLENDIRCVRFVCETPGHASCASQARVSFSMGYSYDPSLA